LIVSTSGRPRLGPSRWRTFTAAVTASCLRSDRLAPKRTCGGYGAVYGAFKSRRALAAGHATAISTRAERGRKARTGDPKPLRQLRAGSHEALARAREPARLKLPTRPQRLQQPPERLLVTWLAQVTQLVNDHVMQDVGGCDQQAPREGEVAAARARPPTRPRVTDGNGSEIEAKTHRLLANDFAYATSGLAAIPAFDGRRGLGIWSRDDQSAAIEARRRKATIFPLEWKGFAGEPHDARTVEAEPRRAVGDRAGIGDLPLIHGRFSSSKASTVASLVARGTITSSGRRGPMMIRAVFARSDSRTRTVKVSSAIAKRRGWRSRSSGCAGANPATFACALGVMLSRAPGRSRRSSTRRGTPVSPTVAFARLPAACASPRRGCRDGRRLAQPNRGPSRAWPRLRRACVPARLARPHRGQRGQAEHVGIGLLLLAPDPF
jgi:hypothetical protein